MNKQTIPYSQTTYFSSLITNYLANDDTLTSFINQKCTIEGFAEAIEQRKKTKIPRAILVESLQEQYKNVKISELAKTNIQRLNNNNCFTVTTGHQLNLFTGPLYFIYKIISTINLAKELKKAYPENDFVPVYWMATEDHDFEEVNHFSLLGESFSLSKTTDGAVGRMKLIGIDVVLEQLKNKLEGRNGSEYIIDLFAQFYLPDKTIAEATRNLVNHLFGSNGLVIIDGDYRELKQVMVEAFNNELVHQNNVKHIEDTTKKLTQLGYKEQVTPREINLFYLKENSRERIVVENGKYEVLNTNIKFTKDEIINEVTNFPERFSPNVVLRPLYQEMILPNLAYIGGGGELAYWFQLKGMFDAHQLFFPTLVLRNSVLIIDGASSKKIKKLNLSIPQLFLATEELIKLYLKENAAIILDVQEEEKLLEDIFQKVGVKAKKIDASLEAMVKSEFQKSLKSLQHIEARIIKAEKQKEDVAVNQIKAIKEKLFPQGGLQERQDNLSMLLLFYGEAFIEELLQHLNPLEKQFTVFYE